MARRAVPVAERSVRRRNRITLDERLAPFVPPAIARAGTAQRAIPTIGKRQMRIRCGIPGRTPLSPAIKIVVKTEGIQDVDAFMSRAGEALP